MSAPDSTTQWLPPCPICLQAGCRPYAIARDRLFGMASGQFRLHCCGSCGAVFQFPVPDRRLLYTFYPPGYWWRAETKPPGAMRRLAGFLEGSYRDFVTLDHVRFVARCARSCRANGQRLTLLDIGCGSGTFLNLARRRGFVSHGLDISADAVAMAKNYYGLDARQGDIGSDVWKAHTFDVVTMFHVLEHLADPRAGLEYAARLLKPRGSLIVQVPNVRSFQARTFGARWHGLDVPRHVINFSPVALATLLRQTGFQILTCRHFSLRDNPAAIASSLAPCLDPVGRSGRGAKSGAAARILSEAAYMGLTTLSLPLALLESLMARGGSIMVHAKCSE